MRLSLVISLFLLSLSLTAQPIQLIFETGANMSGLPRSSNFAGGRERIIPKLSPVLGLHIQFHTRFGLYADAGGRYNSVGTKVTYHKSGRSNLDNTPYTIDHNEVISASRLTYGLGLGYEFKKLNFITGYRKSYYVGGKYTYDYVGESKSGRNEIHEAYRPFDDPNLHTRANRYGWELFAAIGYDLTRRINAQLQFSVPTGFRFTEQFSGFDCVNCQHGFMANDYNLSFNYRLSGN